MARGLGNSLLKCFHNFLWQDILMHFRIWNMRIAQIWRNPNTTIYKKSFINTPRFLKLLNDNFLPLICFDEKLSFMNIYKKEFKICFVAVFCKVVRPFLCTFSCINIITSSILSYSRYFVDAYLLVIGNSNLLE